ncbi:MAG: DUF2934 domain-containing protein [Candidatus Competibacteraceae bacterium]|nr:DUF2934 domain-containing protein [Candidatus Competibacteraceae bacterium]
MSQPTQPFQPGSQSALPLGSIIGTSFTISGVLDVDLSAYRSAGSCCRAIRWIAEAAYYRAKRRGFQGGCSLEDWLEAEREIAPPSAQPAPSPRVALVFLDRSPVGEA